MMLGENKVACLPTLESVERLIPKYDQPLPRYTSYPTTPVWSEKFGPVEYREALRQSRSLDLSLYVHIPFCESLCTYCACNREVRRDHSVVEPYLDALEREADALAEALGSARRGVQLALGGGTPTYLGPDQLRRTCQIIDSRFPPTPKAERSIEVDPRVTTRGHLEALASCGFNRVSLGVQDLSPKVQKAIRRIQSREQTETVAQQARELGFVSVNFDLIYGLPHQELESFEQTLDSVLRMRPDRIALYGYAHVTRVSKQQRGFDRADLPSAAERVALLLLAIRRFAEAGYHFLGLDHFALPEDGLSRAAAQGSLRRNFMGYTTRAGDELVALGASGISELSGAYAQSARTSAEWSARLEEGRLATIRGYELSDEDHRRRWLIESLMCSGEIDPPAYSGTWGEELEDLIPDLEARLEPFVADGLLRRNEPGWGVTGLGRVFLRPIASTFDAYLKQVPARPRFSRAL